MTFRDQSLLSTFAQKVRERFPGAEIRAFGSRARGEARWDSDLDVCVVLDRSVTTSIRAWISDVAWEVGFDADRIITTLVFDLEAFEHGPASASPLVAAIHRDGVPA